ncbi:DUF308 domain-containing protein [Haloglycomyces albus]|uniref:DUF308 domain-containing protein n=1 Tax=Haloglycomyces albus TaxID=526067 RepID=UPI00046D629A|nr:DUF308 domain-containing protein [Haloglycomyces albus]
MADRGHDDHLEPEEVDKRFREMVDGLDEPEAQEKEQDQDKPQVSSPPEEKKEEPTLLELWDAELPDDEDEDTEYRAPEPPPVPWPSLQAIGGVVCLVLGLVAIFAPGLIPFTQTASRAIGVAVFILGVVMLINRLRDEPSDDGERGDGAVVLNHAVTCSPRPRC